MRRRHVTAGEQQFRAGEAGVDVAGLHLQHVGEVGERALDVVDREPRGAPVVVQLRERRADLHGTVVVRERGLQITAFAGDLRSFAQVVGVERVEVDEFGEPGVGLVGAAQRGVQAGAVVEQLRAVQHPLPVVELVVEPGDAPVDEFQCSLQVSAVHLDQCEPVGLEHLVGAALGGVGQQ